MVYPIDITASLKTIPWFLDLKPESLAQLAAIACVTSFETDAIIFNEGDQNLSFYVILDGSVQMECTIPGFGKRHMFTAESLDVIGWSSLTPVVRQNTMTARVLRPTLVMMFDAQKLMSACERDCELGFVIMRRLSNIIASRFLTHRLQLMQLLANQPVQQ